MRSEKILVVTAFFLFVNISLAWAKDDLAFNRYTCREFLEDVRHPNDAKKLIKTLMVVSWATGYASAHQKGDIRDDPRSFELIGAELGAVCKDAPDQIAIKEIVQKIDNLVNTTKMPDSP